MTENEPDDTSEDAEAEAPAAATDNDQDKVKPVVFIGLFITALLGLGKLGDTFVEIITFHLPLCRDL